MLSYFQHFIGKIVSLSDVFSLNKA